MLVECARVRVHMDLLGYYQSTKEWWESFGPSAHALSCCFFLLFYPYSSFYHSPDASVQADCETSIAHSVFFPFSPLCLFLVFCIYIFSFLVCLCLCESYGLFVSLQGKLWKMSDLLSRLDCGTCTRPGCCLQTLVLVSLLLIYASQDKKRFRNETACLIVNLFKHMQLLYRAMQYVGLYGLVCSSKNN